MAGAALLAAPAWAAEGRFGSALDAEAVAARAPHRAEYNARPISGECWARLRGAGSFNILIAHEPKSSATHWELYTYARKGDLSLYMPGCQPAEIRSGAVVTDDKWHHLAFTATDDRVRLFVDGKQVADQGVRRGDKPARTVPGPLAVGALSEGGIGCKGLIDEVRISRGLRKFAAPPPDPPAADEQTLALWRFDEGPAARQFADASRNGNDAKAFFSGSPPQDPFERSESAFVGILPPPGDLPALRRLLAQARQSLKLARRADDAEVRDALLIDWDEQHWHLSNRLSGREKLPGPSEQALDAQALVRAEDGDPLGVVLRRAGALVEHLRSMRGGPDLRDAEADLAALRAAADRTPLDRPDARKGLFLAACEVRRRAAMANPLLDFDSILFIARGVYNGSRAWGQRGTNDRQGQHFQTQYFGFNAIPGGGLYVVRDFKTRPVLVDLLRDAVVQAGPRADSPDRLVGRKLTGGAVLSPDLSCDGRTVVFSWTGNTRPNCYEWTRETTWSLFRIRADGTGLVQLTDGPWDDFDGCFLPAPPGGGDGRIAFISQRRGGYIRCFGGLEVPQHSLHSMTADGGDILPLSYFETGEWQPSVDNHGMIVYTRWDYVDRENCLGSNFWICMPDGRNPRAPHGNYPYPWHTWPDNARRDGRMGRPYTEMNIRAVPGSHKYVATAAPHHGEAFGSLVLLDLSGPDDHFMAQVRRITPYVPFPESEQPARLQYPYGTAWPLSEDFYLCNYWENLYLLDRYGNLELLCENSLVFDKRTNWTMRLIDPIPLRPRAAPPVVPCGTNRGAGARAEGPPATISVMNVYESDQPWPEGTSIRYLRVLQDIPKSNPQMNEPKNMGYHWENTPRVPLGIVPVETDGSAYFEAPVERELIFQALDENHMAVQTMRSVTYVHRGEQMTCLGCHESPTRSPVRPAGPPQALRRAPSKLRPEVGPVEPITFYRLVQPVFQKTCQPCHQDKRKGPQDMSFAKLEPYVFYFSGGMRGSVTIPVHGGTRSIPGRVGARASRMGKALLTPAHRAAVGKDDYRRVVLWLDANAPRLGAFYDEDRQVRGELVWPRLDVDPANPQGLERAPEAP
ncbi:MAG: hypothetical protein BWX88_02579 [Planctomycetes bacterium ADurb.Bin126]|nr:MAG: hypothetical protein BWX88_02579 [Planctomycetes bacterium ADurb.Bin126]